MSGRLVLEPNLGAEDGRPLASVDAALADGLARTWALLFEERAELPPGSAAARPAWLRDGLAAFPFLSDVTGLVPWLSTAAARERARELRLRFAAPSPELSARIGDKGWALETARALGLLPAPLLDVSSLFEGGELERPDARARVDERLASWPVALRESFTLKPRWGSSGRGRVKGRSGRLDDAGAAGLARLARRGGAVLEPWLQRSEDLSAQLLIRADGAVELLGTTRQLTSPSGVWLGNVVLLDEDGVVHSGSARDGELRRAARLVGERAADEGFRGPLGIDAFVYSTHAGAELRPLVEVNARFTMGLVSVGLARRAQAAGLLEAGVVCCFRARLDNDASPAPRTLELPVGGLQLGGDYAEVCARPSTRGRPKRR